MTELIAKHIAKNYISSHTSRDNRGNDLYWERVPVYDRNGRNTGKTRKQRREPPPGVTAEEAAILKKVMRRSETLDNSFNVCGIRVGWGAIVGIVPFLGDFFDTLMAMWVFRECRKCHLSKTVQSRMQMNIIIDFFIGLVPFLGDVGDALWRANTMNAALLYDTLEKRGQERIRHGEAPAMNEKKGARGWAERWGNKGGHGNGTEAGVLEDRRDHHDDDITRPEPVRSKVGGWLDRMGSTADRQAEPDVERGEAGRHQDSRHHHSDRERQASRGRA